MAQVSPGHWARYFGLEEAAQHGIDWTVKTHDQGAVLTVCALPGVVVAGVATELEGQRRS